MKDIIWTAVISVVLATLAALIAVIDPFVEKDFITAVLGLGLASVAFGLAALSDRLGPSSPRAE